MSLKIFILCGGAGTRLDHVGKVIAKPMVRIGKEPILFHLISNFASQKLKEFVICTGYKSETILNFFLKENKKFISDYSKISKNVITFRFSKHKLNVKCNIVYTGQKTATGGRIKLANKLLKLKEDFLMTYGDGLSNINIKKLINFHYKKNSYVTLTAVKPKHKYGILTIKNLKVFSFDDSKSKKTDHYINGGFFIISSDAVNKIKKNQVFWENEPLKYAIKNKKVFAFKHEGFWQSIDTLKDLNELNDLYKKGKMPWKINA